MQTRYLHTVEHFGWTLHIVETKNAIEYLVLDPEGRTVEFSENGYGNAATALRDGTSSLLTLESVATLPRLWLRPEEVCERPDAGTCEKCGASAEHPCQL